MISSDSSPQERLLKDQINDIAPYAYEQLGKIASFERGQACRIVSLIVQFCCAAQHVGAIGAGRNAFKKLPREWIDINLPSIISQAVNLKDPWEYRRLLELLRETNAELLQTYIAAGLKSDDPEIREAACDIEK